MYYTIYTDQESYDKAKSLTRGDYQEGLIAGDESWSGSTLRGAAKNWSSRYRASREGLLERLRANDVPHEFIRGPRGQGTLVIGRLNNRTRDLIEGIVRVYERLGYYSQAIRVVFKRQKTAASRELVRCLGNVGHGTAILWTYEDRAKADPEGLLVDLDQWLEAGTITEMAAKAIRKLCNKVMASEVA